MNSFCPSHCWSTALLLLVDNNLQISLKGTLKISKVLPYNLNLTTLQIKNFQNFPQRSPQPSLNFQINHSVLLAFI